MSPENHDEYVSNWARQTKVPIISINYGKAPENPYPWGLEECFEAYRSIIESNGKAIGIESPTPIKIIITGDSAGANLTVGVMLKCLEFPSGPVRLPHASVLIYPALSFDLECWMKPSYLNLLRTQSHVKMTDGFLKSKTILRKFTPLAIDEAPRAIDVLTNQIDTRESILDRFRPKIFDEHVGPYIHSYLSMTSRMHYFGDRVLPPECMLYLM